MHWMILLVLIWTSSSVVAHSIFTKNVNGSEQCPINCICYVINKTADCHNQDIQDFPILPLFIENLYIRNSSKGNLTKDNLRNIFNLCIKQLTITHCDIPFVEKGVLEGLRYLESLHLNLPSWNASQLKNALVGLGHTPLKSVKITGVKLTKQGSELFNSFKTSNVSCVCFKDNDLLSFEKTTLSALSNITSLTLQHNPITNLSLAGLNNLRKLIIKEVLSVRLKPLDFCEFNLSKLESLVSKDNTYAVFIFPMKCLQSLKNLSFLNHYFNRIDNNSIVNLPKLEKLKFVRTGHGNAYVNKQAFKSNSLKTLIFHGGSHTFSVSEKTFPSNVFDYCSQLEHLDLSDFDMIDVDGNYLSELFKPLNNLTKLIFERNNPYIFPMKFLSHFPNIRQVSLNGNNNADWISQDIFFGVTTLKYLSLQFCALAVINATVIPSQVLDSIETLDLSENSFACNCHQLWFMKWLRNNLKKVKDINKIGSYQCDSPPSHNSLHLLDFHITELNCIPPMWYLLPSSLFLIMIIVGIIVYKYRWHLRYLLYLLHNQKRMLEQPVQCEYHAFVIYCDEDRDFVHETLRKELEIKKKLRLILHFRDFLPGVLIFDNIVNNLYKSRKVILVLSRPFMDSEWCHLEMRMAQKMGLEMGKDIFVVIVLDSLKFTRIGNKFVRKMLLMHNYLEYSERDTVDAKEKFWKLINEALVTNSLEDFHESGELTPLLPNSRALTYVC